MHTHALHAQDQTDLKIRQLCGSSAHHGGTLCRLREPNLHVAIVEDGMVGSHEYIAQDPRTASSHCQSRGQQFRGAFTFSISRVFSTPTAADKSHR